MRFLSGVLLLTAWVQAGPAKPARAELTLSGDVITAEGAAEQGMVMDFSEVRAIAQRCLVDAWDHAFLAWRGDKRVVEFLGTLPGHKTVLLEAPPTAEHLAIAAFRILDHAYQDKYGNNLKLERVRVYESPNCWADATKGE